MNSLKKLIPYIRPHLRDAILAPLLMVLEVSMDLAQPRFLQQIVDDGIGNGDVQKILSTGILMILFAVVGAIGGIGCTVFAVRAGQKMGADLRSGLFRKVQTFSHSNIDNLKTGELVTRLTNDVVQVQEMVMILLRIMIRAPALLIGSLIMAVITSPKLSIILVILVPILTYILIRVTRKGYPLFAGVQRGLDRVNTVMRENLAGVRVVKAFVRHDHEVVRFGGANDNLMAKSMTAMRLMAVVLPLSLLVVNSGVVAVIWYGGFGVTAGVISIGQIMAFVNYLLQALNSMMMVGMLLIRISRAMASADRIEEVLETEPGLEKSTGGKRIADPKGKIEFGDVWFRYDADPVLKEINFAVNPGQKIAVLGATGSGKSSLVHLIPRFYDPYKGSVLIDGVDAKSVPEEDLRKLIRIVPQETILFSGSIEENIRYGKLKADAEEIKAAADIAQAHDFIKGFNDGYDTALGQRGVNLSGGQKQRIAIARAVVAKPSILILDDCTSAVDVETEALIQEAIAARLAGTTIVIVAQRISSVLSADQILVMEDGEIAASGNHSGLMESSTMYQDIFASQLEQEWPLMASKTDKRQAADTFSRGGGPGWMIGRGKKAKDAAGTAKRLWGYLRRHGKSLAGVSSMVAVSTVLGTLGPYLMGRAIDTKILPGDRPGIAAIAMIMALVYACGAATNWIQARAMVGISQRTLRDLRQDLFARLQELSLCFFDANPHGELMSRVANDIENINNVLSQSVLQLLASVLTMGFVTAMMFAINWQLAAAALVILPIMAFATTRIAKRTRSGFRNQQKDLGELNGIIEERISGHRVVTAFGRQADAIAEFEQANGKLRSSAIRAQTYAGLLGPMGNFINHIGFTVVACIGAWFAVRDLITVGMVAAFLSYARQFTRPVNQIASLYNSIQSALAGAERVFEIIDEEPDITDRNDSEELKTIQGHVEFRDVSFGYNKETQVLDRVNFEAQPGDTVALVGPTGAGKTTQVNLLSRFYDIDEGEILLDGMSTKKIKKNDLRRCLGVVLQDTYLFSIPLIENIRYGNPDATDEQVYQAAELANADHFIKHLPDGYNTMLSEDGSNLSQGQRQLIAIARAALTDPAILILDEATSSVDTRTEIHIQRALLRLMDGRTSFVIAHRLSTIRNADIILVIDEGRIQERGTHDQLLENQGFYYTMYTSQFRGLDWRN